MKKSEENADKKILRCKNYGRELISAIFLGTQEQHEQSEVFSYVNIFNKKHHTTLCDFMR